MPRITRESLTLKAITAAKPSDKLYRLRDAAVPGLLLRVTPGGGKVWAITWGRGQEHTIGNYPVMTLEAARQAVIRELAEVAEHGRPLALIEHKKAKALTLKEFIEQAFQPWAVANLKWSEGAASRILSVGVCRVH